MSEQSLRLRLAELESAMTNNGVAIDDPEHDIGILAKKAKHADILIGALEYYAECEDGCTCGNGWIHSAAVNALELYTKRVNQK